MAAQFPHQNIQLLHSFLYLALALVLSLFFRLRMFISPILYQGTKSIPHILNKQEPAEDCYVFFADFFFFEREYPNIKVQTRRNVRNLTHFSKDSESTP